MEQKLLMYIVNIALMKSKLTFCSLRGQLYKLESFTVDAIIASLVINCYYRESQLTC
jgi:hypothetical protein